MPASLYFDHINGAPLRPEAAAAVSPWLGPPANPQMEHRFGRAAQAALERARVQVAALSGGTGEILFGASGTEVCNLAVKGYLKANRRRGRHIVLSAVEHPAVDRAVKRMEDDGWSATRVAVDRHGLLDPADVTGAVGGDTALVCVQLANPEMGAIQPVARIAESLPEKTALMVDAVAACGRLPIDVARLGADMLALASSPIGGPAGAAALLIKKGLRLQPEIDGGVQESGRRGGLENVAAICGFGAAAEVTATRLAEETTHLNALADRFRERLAGETRIRFSGPEKNRLPGHVSLLADGMDGQSLLAVLDAAGVAASSGSFCGAKAMKASAVLTAMGYPAAAASSGIVFSFGPANTPEEVDRGAGLLRECMDRCRMSLPGGAPP